MRKTSKYSPSSMSKMIREEERRQTQKGLRDRYLPIYLKVLCVTCVSMISVFSLFGNHDTFHVQAFVVALIFIVPAGSAFIASVLSTYISGVNYYLGRAIVSRENGAGEFSRNKFFCWWFAIIYIALYFFASVDRRFIFS